MLAHPNQAGQAVQPASQPPPPPPPQQQQQHYYSPESGSANMYQQAAEPQQQLPNTGAQQGQLSAARFQRQQAPEMLPVEHAQLVHAPQPHQVPQHHQQQQQHYTPDSSASLGDRPNPQRAGWPAKSQDFAPNNGVMRQASSIQQQQQQQYAEQAHLYQPQAPLISENRQQPVVVAQPAPIRHHVGPQRAPQPTSYPTGAAQQRAPQHSMQYSATGPQPAQRARQPRPSMHIPGEFAQAAPPMYQQQQQQFCDSTDGIPSGATSVHWRPAPGNAPQQQQQQQQNYPANSPTLLQQQLNLNRQHQVPIPAPVSQQQLRLPVGPEPVTQPTTQQQQQQQFNRQRAGQLTRPYAEHQQILPPESSSLGGPADSVTTTYHLPVDHNTQQQQPTVRPHLSGERQAYYANQQPQEPTCRVAPRPPHHLPLTDRSTHHLLGNPTPPLTPNSQLGQLRNPAENPQQQHWSLPQAHHASSNHVQQPPPAGYNGNHLAIKQQQQQQQPPPSSSFVNGNPQPGMSLPNLPGQQQQSPQRIMPKNHALQAQQQQQYHPPHNNLQHSHGHHQAQQHHHHLNQQQQLNTSQQQVSMSQQSLPPSNPHNHHHHHQQHPPPPQLHQQHQQQQNHLHHTQNTPDVNSPVAVARTLSIEQQLIRLTLPLGNTPLLGPFKLEHDAQFTSKVFHIKPQLFETLSKSINLMNPQTATVIQELQFRAYVVKTSDHHHHHHHHQHYSSSLSSQAGDSLLANSHQTADGKPCSWPELFQVTINQNIIHLDRTKDNHKAADIFRFCRNGPNNLEIQVNDCYCSHEFVMEAVDRPTLKAFMNSCFKSRLLATDSCIQKMKFNFGNPNFLVQNQQLQQSVSIFNEYITEFVNGIEQTKTRISLRCPISGRRMRTPTRGQNCKHLQCFDLENFLVLNRERSRWNCPICSLSIPFTMLELDQHQINIVQSMSEIFNTDDIIMDAIGQWQTYYAPVNKPQQLPPPTISHMPSQSHQQHQPSTQNTARSTGTYHPQPQVMNSNSPSSATNVIHQQPMRPMSGPVISSNGPPVAGRVSSGSPALWDNQVVSHPLGPMEGTSGSGNPTSNMQMHVNQPIRRPASAISQSTSRQAANGSPLAKKAYNHQYNPQQSGQQFQSAPPPKGPFFNDIANPAASSSTATAFNENIEELSPLAAMERTIVQHEQQMGPPPFDPNSLTSSPARNNTSVGASPLGNTFITSANPSSLSSPSSTVPQQPTPQQQQPASINMSPSGGDSRMHSTPATPFSPHTPHGISSPACRMVPASPQQQQPRGPPTDLPQSPAQQQQQAPNQTSISTPATPSSSMITVLGGPETPATPSNSGCAQQQCGPSSVSSSNLNHSNTQSSSLNNSSSSSNINGCAQQSGVDQQPLSNGSASAGSITSTSTMTPSGQSLGSVGMGGDSRCNTAPLQGNGNGTLNLDDLMIPGGISSSQLAGSSLTQSSRYNNNKQSHHHLHQQNSPHLDDKNEILMNKLMMDSHESIFREHHRSGELAQAFEEAEWKQQLDRGKSEHLANFLNEPLMKKQQQQHYQQQQQQQQQHASSTGSKMLSGGLNPSDDEGGNQSHNSSPIHNLDQLEFGNYLDPDGADNGAGLPPDDSILDLFER